MSSCFRERRRRNLQVILQARWEIHVKYIKAFQSGKAKHEKFSFHCASQVRNAFDIRQGCYI